MAVAVRLAATVVTVATSIAFTACGAARVGAPVPRPFPSPSSPTTAPPSEARSAPVAPSSGGADFVRYLAMLEELETGGNCFARPVAGSAMGCYQMTRAALQDAKLKDAAGDWLDNEWNIDSDEEFLRNRHAQVAAVLRYTTNNWLQLEPCLRDYVGRTVGGVTLDQGALVAGAHLLGATGLIRFVRCELRASCISPEAAALNGNRRLLRANAVRRMHAARGLRILAARAGSGSRCGLQG